MRYDLECFGKAYISVRQYSVIDKKNRIKIHAVFLSFIFVIFEVFVFGHGVKAK